MPLHIARRGEQHCLVGPDGTSEYCHDTYDEALAQLRAIEANKQAGMEPTVRAVLESRIHQSFTVASDELFGLGYMDREQRIALSGLISEMLTTFGESIDESMANTAVSYDDARLVIDQNKDLDMPKETTSASVTTSSSTGSTDIWTVQDASSGEIHPLNIRHEKQRDDEEKSFGGLFVTTFAELDAARKAEQRKQEAITTISDFMVLSSNAMEWEDDPVKAVESLAAEMVARLKAAPPQFTSDDEEEEDDMPEEEKEQPRVVVPELGKKGFMVWKQNDGTYRWLGVYSNKFRDDDRPVQEIISEKAHKEFIDRVNKGEIANPDLYVWHIKVPVGKSDLLAYDDSGFSVVSGTFTNDSVAEALLVTSEDLAMSHGMPAEFIERDKNDKSVITRYISTEVSVLPRSAAANKRTSFSVLTAKEEDMAINPELRGKVVSMIGEEATASIEEGLAGVAKEALESGVDFKETGEDVTVADTTDVTEEIVSEEEDVATSEVEAEVTEEPVEEPAEEAPAQKDDQDAGEQTDPIQELKQEFVELIATVVKTVEDSNAKLTERLQALEEASQAQTKEKEKDGQPQTTASMAAMLASQLAGSHASSVIGKQATQVHGNSTLAKDAPAQEMGEEAAQQGGLFFQKWTN